MFSKTRERHAAGMSRGGHGRTLIGLGLIVGSMIWGASKLGWSITAVNWATLTLPIVSTALGVFILLGSGRRIYGRFPWGCLKGCRGGVD